METEEILKGQEYTFVNEQLTEEEESLDCPHLTVSRKRLRLFLDTVDKIADQKDPHCAYILMDVDSFEREDGTIENKMILNATDSVISTMLQMEIPVLNTKNVYDGKPVVIKSSVLRKIDGLLMGNNITFRLLDTENHKDVHVHTLFCGGWIRIPTGSYTEETFSIKLGEAQTSVELAPTEVYKALTSLIPVLTKQSTGTFGTVVFKDSYAFVEDVGGYVRYDGAFFTHRLPLWVSSILKTLIRSTQTKTLTIQVQRNSVSDYPFIHYKGDSFEFIFTRYGNVNSSYDRVNLSSGVSVNMDTLKSLAKLPTELQADMQDFYDNTVTLMFDKDSKTGNEEFHVILGGKTAEENVHVIGYETFGELRDYFKIKVPAALLKNFLCSCPSTESVNLMVKDNHLYVSSGAWSCSIDAIVD